MPWPMKVRVRSPQRISVKLRPQSRADDKAPLTQTMKQARWHLTHSVAGNATSAPSASSTRRSAHKACLASVGGSSRVPTALAVLSQRVAGVPLHEEAAGHLVKRLADIPIDAYPLLDTSASLVMWLVGRSACRASAAT
jgi:hypothetical protein